MVVQKLETDREFQVELCNTMKELYKEKILTDIGGNLSFRSPQDENIFWITPSGKKKDTVEPEDLIKMNFKGEILSDSSLKPSIEWPMHLKIYEEDEDFKVILHSHAPLATALSIVKNPPEMPNLTGELTMLVPKIQIVPFEKSGSKELGIAVGEALWDSSVVILENHGVVAIGKDFKEASIKTRALEEYLQLYINAKYFGDILKEFPGF